ncbi:MAG: cytochrome c biogenesis protein ResB [Burkholderiales bacterium]|nr:cytochrome c biogenesis protein ResB [Burkholderiales bacterium]
MRFAIALLTLICIASMIGTVVTQREPFNNYVNQFGPFWAPLFDAVGLYTVYSAGWFLLILGFLVVSVSLCIARNAPKILVDIRSFKEHLREQSLSSFHHKAEGSFAIEPAAMLQRVSDQLAARGWSARADVRANGTMVAARKGVANRLGYLSAHSAIVLVCLGGLFDGDLVVRAQMALLGKSVFSGGGLIKDVAARHRLADSNPTFRGNLLVPEGARAGVAVLQMPDGVVLQELPFDVELKKFRVDFYDTGMPKLFASEIVIHDHATGQALPATVKVNEPVFHRGVAIYQSSFDDNGSRLKLHAIPMQGTAAPFELNGTVGETAQISNGDDKIAIEFTGLRVMNVENFGAAAPGPVDARKVDLVGTLEKHLGSGAKPADASKTLRNIGPSVSYKLVDASGQRREFNNYMVPVTLDGQSVFLAGVREDVNDSFRYLRIPADEQGSITGWQRLRAALRDPAARAEAARRYVVLATPPDKPQMAEQLRITAERALALFAGSERARKGGAPGGLGALAQFIEGSVPEAERSRISDVLLRILNGCLVELANLSRERAGLQPLPPGNDSAAFMQQAVLSLSDATLYPAPVMLQLAEFTQVQASVFQVARAPGKTLVYLGAVLLIIGVFAMLYIRERRLWIWLQADTATGGTLLRAALSTTRRTLDADAEFEAIKAELLKDAR